MIRNLFLIACCLVVCASCRAENSHDATNSKYLKIRKDFTSNLLKKGKAPQDYTPIKPVEGSIKLIQYPSGGYLLQGLIDTTNIDPNKRKPVIVYLHGGFALSASDVEDCKPFTDAGYIIFAPSYRGENGNDGNFEFFLGEVDDAQASIAWLSRQLYIDSTNIFVFGHSIGGGMSLLLSMYPNLPIKKAASSAGLYYSAAIKQWEKEDGIIPFDLKNDVELYVRLPTYSLEYLQRKHLMYIGTDDDFAIHKDIYDERYPNANTLFDIREVPGNHFTSLPIAMKKFIEEIKK